MDSTEPADASARRRAEILEAARRQFRATGLAGTSLAAIADAAGVRRSHLYRYFEDKTDLVSAVVAVEASAINERRADALGATVDFGEQIVRSLELAVELVDRDPFWASLIEPGNVPYTAYAATSDPELLGSNAAYWTPILQQARARHELRADLSDEEVMTWLLGLQFLFLQRREIFATAADIRHYVTRFVLPALVSTSRPATTSRPAATS